jgi:hypothetical protein
MTAILKPLIIICEGKSEDTYIKELHPFFVNRGFSVIPKIANGSSGLVKTYKKVRKENRNSRIVIWCDGDFLERKKNIPKELSKALTNIWNFEDHLMLHFDRKKVLEWQAICEKFHHFDNPMNGEEVTKNLRMLIPDYRKGELPKQLMLNKETFLKFLNNNRDSEIKFRSGFFELLSVIGINKE